MGIRSMGGSSSTDISRIPIRLIWRVLGIGVAVRVSTSTFFFSCLIFSLCLTPKRCSSSITNSPKSLNSTSFDSRRWVPMTTSTPPFLSAFTVLFCWAVPRKRQRRSTYTGKSFILWINVL